MENKPDLDKGISSTTVMTTPRFNYQDILSTVINADIQEYDRGPLICLDESREALRQTPAIYGVNHEFGPMDHWSA